MRAEKNRAKYGFHLLNVLEEKTLSGNYHTVRICANQYSKKHNCKIKAIRTGENILLKRTA